MLPAFLRPACLAPAAAGAGLFVWLVPINEGPAGTALVVAFVWLFLAYAIHAVRDLVVAVREMASRKPMRASRAGAPAAAAAQHAAPVLGAQGRAAVRDIVALFADAGVFAPSAPEPGHLFEAAADLGEPVTQGVVLAALHEAGIHHATFDASRYMANLAFHDGHSEQDATTLRGQIDDIVRLAGGALEVRDVTVDLSLDAADVSPPACVIRMTVNGTPVSLAYVPAAKYLSTSLHVALAVALRNQGAVARLAWTWNDQGVWLSLLRAHALAQLNAGPGTSADLGSGWEWVDESTPFAAGSALAGRQQPLQWHQPKASPH